MFLTFKNCMCPVWFHWDYSVLQVKQCVIRIWSIWRQFLISVSEYEIVCFSPSDDSTGFNCLVAKGLFPSGYLVSTKCFLPERWALKHTQIFTYSLWNCCMSQWTASTHELQKMSSKLMIPIGLKRSPAIFPIKNTHIIAPLGWWNTVCLFWTIQMLVCIKQCYWHLSS